MVLGRLAAAAAAGVLAGGLMLAGVAYADHNVPLVAASEQGECGTTTFISSWPEETHKVATTVLVVQVDGQQHIANIGDPLTVGPFDSAVVTIRWRVWGGGERNYDQPPLDDLQALLDHLSGGGKELDLDPPGVAWNEFTVKGCEPEPTAPPTTPAEPGEGGGDEEKPDLPATSGLTGLPLLLGGGTLLVIAGAGAMVFARRRRAPSPD